MSLKTAVVKCLYYPIPMKAKYLRIGFLTIVAVGLAMILLTPERPEYRLRRGMVASDVERLMGKPTVVLESNGETEWKYQREGIELFFNDGTLTGGGGHKGSRLNGSESPLRRE